MRKGGSHGDEVEQSSQDYDRGYDQGNDEGYQNGHDEGFHDDPECFDDDFFE